MYSFNSRVRYSEINQNKQLDLYSIINYYQDCSTFQTEDIGKGFDYLCKMNRIWLMNAWQININRFPTMGEYITISTWAYDFKGMYGYRNFKITDCNNEVCSYANSIWVYMDTNLNRPAKITEEDISGYGSDEPYPMEYAPRKIEVPHALQCKEAFPVRKGSLDTNNHVNNGQYIKMAQEYLPDDFSIRQMRAEYKKSAMLGDIILPLIFQYENLYTVVLADTLQKPYAIIEFIGN
ncbi:MAG: acyl-[acyl-carrier-protein] thioesterase [Anaerocolumna sp.]